MTGMDRALDGDSTRTRSFSRDGLMVLSPSSPAAAAFGCHRRRRFQQRFGWAGGRGASGRLAELVGVVGRGWGGVERAGAEWGSAAERRRAARPEGLSALARRAELDWRWRESDEELGQAGRAIYRRGGGFPNRAALWPRRQSKDGEVVVAARVR
jgi:hypothetical protein